MPFTYFFQRVSQTTYGRRTHHRSEPPCQDGRDPATVTAFMRKISGTVNASGDFGADTFKEAYALDFFDRLIFYPLYFRQSYGNTMNTGMKEAVSTAFPSALYRSSSQKYAEIRWRKNKKEFANDLKTIYHAPSEETALEALNRVTKKWEKNYPNAMKSWYKNWDVISPIFKFSSDVRKVICATNAIESLNSKNRSGYFFLPLHNNAFYHSF